MSGEHCARSIAHGKIWDWLTQIGREIATNALGRMRTNKGREADPALDTFHHIKCCALCHHARQIGKGDDAFWLENFSSARRRAASSTQNNAVPLAATHCASRSS